MRGVSYPDRLQTLNLKSLEERRIMYDLILLYKIINNLVDFDHTNLFSMNTNRTRGHSQKINIQHARLNCRKFFYINRTAPIWNNLSEEQVTAPSLGQFKTKIESANLLEYCRGRALMAE